MLSVAAATGVDIITGAVLVQSIVNTLRLFITGAPSSVTITFTVHVSSWVQIQLTTPDPATIAGVKLQSSTPRLKVRPFAGLSASVASTS